MCFFSTVSGFLIAVFTGMTIYQVNFRDRTHIISFLAILWMVTFSFAHLLNVIIPFVAGLTFLFFVLPEVRAGGGRYETAGGSGKTVFSGALHTLDYGEEAKERQTSVSKSGLVLISSIVILSNAVIGYLV